MVRKKALLVLPVFVLLSLFGCIESNGGYGGFYYQEEYIDTSPILCESVQTCFDKGVDCGFPDANMNCDFFSSDDFKQCYCTMKPDIISICPEPSIFDSSTGKCVYQNSEIS